jgi:predicted permease
VTFVLPVANILSILVMASTCGKDKKITPGGVMLTIVKNPIIITTAVGLGLVLPGIVLPSIIDATLDYIAEMATPLALLCIGASMGFSGFDKKFKYALTGSFIKIILLPIAFGGLAYLFGFRGYDLAAMTIMGGVPSAIAGYAMVVEMGGDGYVASTIVIISTLFSAFTLTLMIYGMRVLGMVG